MHVINYQKIKITIYCCDNVQVRRWQRLCAAVKLAWKDLVKIWSSRCWHAKLTSLKRISSPFHDLLQLIWHHRLSSNRFHPKPFFMFSRRGNKRTRAESDEQGWTSSKPQSLHIGQVCPPCRTHRAMCTSGTLLCKKKLWVIITMKVAVVHKHFLHLQIYCCSGSWSLCFWLRSYQSTPSVPTVSSWHGNI